ncbi:hypothetical protein E2C01_061910 [Portunus trituberculatus]|uniref:HTH CENPB-type domain-containing protein n=1 Tax=Portunus trituberculatus TaxID=210409 RepID=A0A5B7HEI3_PORTR|nr:hypothetical protein [Portunus trituberculatus]
MENRFFERTTKDIKCRQAFQMDERNKIPHNFHHEAGLAGKDWLDEFRKQHPQFYQKQTGEQRSTPVTYMLGKEEEQEQEGQEEGEEQEEEEGKEEKKKKKKKLNKESNTNKTNNKNTTTCHAPSHKHIVLMEMVV